MANKAPEHLANILQAIGETPNTALWDCHGTWVVKHKALEKVASFYGILFNDPVIIETDIKNLQTSFAQKNYDVISSTWLG